MKTHTLIINNSKNRRHLFRFFFLIWGLFNLFSLQAQTPNFVTQPILTGGTGNTLPYGVGARSQTLYPASVFSGISSAKLITAIYMVPTVSGPWTYTNFEVSLGQPNITSLSNATYVTGTTRVLTKTNYTVNRVADNWLAFPLDVPFLFDPTKPLVVEINLTNAASTIWASQKHNPVITGGYMNYSGSYSDAVPIGSVQTDIALLGLDLKTTTANNASVTKLVSPTSFCSNYADIKVRIKNLGSNLITNVDIGWSLDGVAQPTVIWSYPMDTVRGAYPNDTVVTLGNVFFGAAAQALKVWTEHPNSAADSDHSDDTLNVTVSAALNGAYTIGGATPHFATIADAVKALNSFGVCGPVTFNVAPNSGPYSGTVAFKTIWGASDVNTITFNGNGNTITGVYRPLVSFLGSGYITLDSFNIIAPTGYSGSGIQITNHSHHLTITHNKINVGTVNTEAAIAVSGSVNVRFLAITHNEVIGGTYSVALTGNSLITYTDHARHLIAYNTFRDFVHGGIYVSNGDSITIAYNDINRITLPHPTQMSGVINLSGCRNIKVQNNKLHHFGVGAYLAYIISINACVNTPGSETEISNNLIYSIGTSGIMHGITFPSGGSSGINIYHNTIQHEVPNSNSEEIRGISFAIACININLKNNIISIKGEGTGVKTGIFVSSTFTVLNSNNNVIHVSTGTSDNIGYWGTYCNTLLNWRSASLQDALSVSSDPILSNPSAGNVYPLSANCDNTGTALSAVTTDFEGTFRPPTPDPGALEFTGISNDITITKGALKRSNITCYSTTDTALITIKNVIGATIDFSITPLKIVWKTTGPVNTTDSFMVNSGTLDEDSVRTFKVTTVNMSKVGDYILQTYINPNAVNSNMLNDTFIASPYTIRSVLEIAQKTLNLIAPTGNVELTAKSTLFPGGAVFLSEISHSVLIATGQPTAGWPDYLVANSYVELTGIPNADMAGYIMEEWAGSTLQHTVTFPAGTLFSPNGTMILATGNLGGSNPVPSSFYYHTGNTSPHSPLTAKGYVLKNPTGTIIDVVAYGAHTFFPSSGVTAAHWSGSTPAVSGCGNRLNAPDNNTSGCWINSGTSPQDPNVINTGVTAPAYGTIGGFNWIYLGNPIASTPKTTVGPFSTPGIYTYIAKYTNSCGTFYDTARITVNAPAPVKLITFTATKTHEDVNLEWNTASETSNSHFEIEKSMNGVDFSVIGKVKGMGTTNITRSYSFLDEKAINTSSNILYYRLKQVDNNGASTYSRTAVVTLSNKQITGLATHPNPSNGIFTITADLASTSSVNMKVVNIMGATVWNETMTPVMGANAFDAQLQLPDGVYMLVFEQDGETSTQKFVVQK